jgi:hypothetical protein
MNKIYSLKVNQMMDGQENKYTDINMSLGAVFCVIRFILANRIAHHITGEWYVINQVNLTVRMFTITESGFSMMTILRGVKG